MFLIWLISTSSFDELMDNVSLYILNEKIIQEGNIERKFKRNGKIFRKIGMVCIKQYNLYWTINMSTEKFSYELSTSKVPLSRFSLNSHV